MDKGLLDRFFAGNCTEEEARAVLRWYFSNQMDEEIAARFEKYWEKEAPSSREWNASGSFDDLISRIPELQQHVADPSDEGEDAADYFGEPGQHRIKTPLHPLAKVAAVLIFFACAGALWLQFWGTGNSGSELVVKSAARGEMLKVMLPDRSVVILNADSRIEFRKEFSSDKREINLEGEAFFEVTPDKERPFIVTSGNVATTALGTSFNISCRLDSMEKQVEISLVSGSVRVEKTGRKGTEAGWRDILLQPGQRAFLDAQSQLAKTDFNEKEVLWKNGILYFNATPFRDVLSILERWYDVDIEVVNNNADRQYSGEFKDETLENVLESIAFSGGFRYEIDDRKVRIDFDKTYSE